MRDTNHQKYIHRSTTEARDHVLDALSSPSNHYHLPYINTPEEIIDYESRCRTLHDRISRCCLFPVLYRSTDTGILAISQSRCKSRACPHCSIIRGNEIEKRIQTLIKHCDSPRLLTLTLKSSKNPLSTQLQHLKSSFNKLRRTKQWKTKIKGGLSILEITWNPSTGWNPHLHCVVDATYWKQSSISLLWKKITTDSPIIDIRMIYSIKNTSHYISKYISKSWGILDYPSHITAELCLTMHGIRTLSTFGHLHGIKTPPRTKVLTGEIKYVQNLFSLYNDAYNGTTRAKRIVFVLETLTRKHRTQTDREPSPALIKAMRRIYRKLKIYNNPPIKIPSKPPDPRTLFNPKPSTTPPST